MGSRLRKLFDSAGWIFRDGGSFPWSDEHTIIEFESDIKRFNEEKAHETETTNACDVQKRKEMLIRLAWVLVHSRDPARVHQGLGMLEVRPNDDNSVPEKEQLYLRAVGYYRSGDYAEARKILEKCMERYPTWIQPMSLQKLLDSARKRDGLIGIGIVSGLGGAIGAVGFLAGGMVTAGLVATGAVIAATASTIKNKKSDPSQPRELEVV